MQRNPFLAVVLLAALPAASQVLLRKAPPDVEEALRARVDQFYSLFQERKFRQAEAFVAEESRDRFYAMSKAPVQSFKVESVDFDDSFQTAKVLVVCESASPQSYGVPVPMPVTGKWKLIDGVWHLVIEPRKTTPFGPMSWSDPKLSKPDPMQPPTLETLASGSFQVEPQKLVFSRQGQETITRTVTVKNNLPGLMTLEVEAPDLPGLMVAKPDKNIPPKGQITFQVRYDPVAGKVQPHCPSCKPSLSGNWDIIVRVQPLNQAASIALQFE